MQNIDRSYLQGVKVLFCVVLVADGGCSGLLHAGWTVYRAGFLTCADSCYSWNPDMDINCLCC